MQLPSDDHQLPFILSPQKSKDHIRINPEVHRIPSEKIEQHHLRSPLFLKQRPLSTPNPVIMVSQRISPNELAVNYKQALKVLIVNTIPLIITFFAMFSVRNLSLHYIKGKNKVILTSALGISTTLIGVVGLAVFMSLNAGLVSRSAQAFGAKNYQLIGFYLHRGFIINVLAMLPGYCIIFFSDAIFSSLGFDPELSRFIQKFSTYSIPGLFAMMVFNTLSSYLYSCDIFLPSSVVLVGSSIVFSILSYFLIVKTDMDVGAVAISYNTMYFLAAIALFLYIKIKDPVPGSFFWFKAQSFKEVWTLFKQEVLVGSMIFLEWIAYEIIYLFAGRLSLVEVTAITIVYTNSLTLLAVPLSLSDSVLAFVGNSMGEGDVKKAKYFLKAGLTLTLIALAIVETFYFFFTRMVAEFYTGDSETIEKTIKLFRVYVFMFPADFVQCVLSSGLRATGKEKLGSIIVLVCYYLIEIPLSFILCFYADMRAMGLVYGPVISLYCMLICLIFVYSKIDWEKQANIIVKRIEKDREILKRDLRLNSNENEAL